MARWVHDGMYLHRPRCSAHLQSQTNPSHENIDDLMAEVALSSQAGSDGAKPQQDSFTERNDSVVGPLPTEGYLIFDARPTSELSTNVVSRWLLLAVLDYS